ncbi:hypothetical protein MSG28_004666 [Choristoneura fumiferana]|uniref:Uncharacterized protein n=1 Tax=Choristoneura fumiferana TaxID=7141 RepID=A0ACC0K7V0_CHOFU|nr:hypothetical protein MSG28_004666 [Choristoneura fumiferana]
MSIPPVNYSVPPPRLDMPPPVAPPLGPLSVPPPQLFQHPPPYALPPIPPIDKPPPLPITSLPPLNVPPPPVTAYPPPIIPPPYPPPPVKADHAFPTPDFSNPPPPKPKEQCIKKPEDTHLYQQNLESPSGSRERGKDYYESRSHHSSSRERYSPLRHRGRSIEREREYREGSHRHHTSNRSPSHTRSASYSRSRHSRSPSRYNHRDRDREYCKEREGYRESGDRDRAREIEKERYYRDRYHAEKMEHERRRYEYERRHSPSHHRESRSYSRSHDPREERYRRSPSRRSCRSPGRDSHRHSHVRDMSPRSRQGSATRKPLTDREKILEEYRKNYCQTSEDFIEKMEKWSKEHNHEEEEAPKMWYRSSPAELYYKPAENGVGVQQTQKLERICDTFFKKVIERGRKARPEVDELPPLKPPKAKMCKHRLDEKSSSSSSSDSEGSLDEDGLQGYTDRIMVELQRKQSHPRRLHPEMWFNNTGEMNGGPLCRCSARARRHGMRHGVYAGEQTFPKCDPRTSNIDKLYHYRITVSPPTNFLIKAPTIIGHDEHEFLFSGFSMFSHYKLAKLPTCKVIRFNIEYTILYVEEPAPQNFTVRELDLFEEFLFTELLELVDLDLGKATETSCSQFHFLPRFVRFLPEGGCEVLSMCEVLKYLLNESGLLIPPDMLEDVHGMDHYTWQKFVDRIKGMIVTYPGKKPCSVRVDQLDRSPPVNAKDVKNPKELKKFFPEIVHFGIRPPQLSYAGNPEYQKAWRYYVKYRHLIANMAKPSFKERQKLAAKEAKLQEMRTQSKMKRDVTVAISSDGFHTTGLMCDIVQHAMLIPVLVRHLRFHKSLDSLENKMSYVFKQRALLQTALTHPSYRENFGTNPDHARNSLTNCGIRQPEYGDRRIHYTRKKGIVTLINIMSRFGKHIETESEIKHNERLEFLGDAVVEFLSSIHLFRMFPGLAEGGLATYRASIVQNQHLAKLAKNIELEQFMLYAHGSDLCRDVVMRHAMANCFEALMGALFLDGGIQERAHPLQEQEPLGDRKYIKDFKFLQKLTEFEDSIGVYSEPGLERPQVQAATVLSHSKEHGGWRTRHTAIQCLGPTNTRVYTVGVYFRGARLAAARGHSIQEAEMNAAEQALEQAHGN